MTPPFYDGSTEKYKMRPIAKSDIHFGERSEP